LNASNYPEPHNNAYAHIVEIPGSGIHQFLIKTLKYLSWSIYFEKHTHARVIEMNLSHNSHCLSFGVTSPCSGVGSRGLIFLSTQAHTTRGLLRGLVIYCQVENFKTLFGAAYQQNGRQFPRRN
jgi:hypothetical protein